MSEQAVNTPIRTFCDLVVWQKAHAFVLRLYRETELFPKHELYCLTSQVRRSAISIPANIAEGFRRRTEQEKLRYLEIARGSLEETRYFLILARDLGYLQNNESAELLDEVGRLLEGYTRSIRNSKC